MRHKHCMTWNMARNTEKREKREMPTLGPGIMAIKLTKKKNEKLTLQDLEHGEKTEE